MKIKLMTLFAAALAIAAACTPKEDPSKVKTVTVEPSNVTVTVGTTKTLQLNVEPATAIYEEVVWTSDDAKVAKVSRKGMITAVAEGETYIHVTVDGIIGDCHVTVVASTTPVTSVSLDVEEATLGVGETLTLTPTVLPADAGLKSVTWTSSDKTVATVADGVVTAAGEGNAIITVTTDDGGFEATCNITVISNDIHSIAFAGASDKAKVVDFKAKETLAVNYTPKSTTEKGLTWTSSDPSVASVASAGEGLGTVTFQEKIGPVTITATSTADGSVSASQSFYVRDVDPFYSIDAQTIYAGKKTTYKFNKTVYTGATSVKWATNGKEVSGEEALLAVDAAGENTIVMTAAFGDVVVEEPFTVNAEQWYIDMDIPDGLGANNCTPVFSKDCKYAYFLTQGTKRCLVALNLEERKIGWTYEFPSSETAANNGGNLSVNPLTGDIVCPSSSRVYCIAKDGTKKWETDRIETNTTRNPTMYSGCGACFSNDCSVVFMCCTPRALYAFKASDGTILDKFSFLSADGYPESNQCQMAIYGNDNIVVHLKGYMAVFFSFNGSKFTMEKQVATALSGSGYPTDMSSCAVTADQSTVFFGGYAMQSVSLTEKEVIATANTGATKWHMAPSITEDNHMYLAVSEYSGSDAAVLYLESPSMKKVSAPFSNGVSGVDALKFSSVPCDRNGNAYFCFWDKNNHTITFYTSAKGAEAKVIASAESRAENGTATDDYQGCFNFGDGYLVAATGAGPNLRKGKILVRCIDAERAHSWSGHGGDVCSTKNANLVYATK